MQISCKKTSLIYVFDWVFSGTSLYLGLFCGRAGCFITLGLRGQGFNGNGGFRIIILGRPAAGEPGGTEYPSADKGFGGQTFFKMKCSSMSIYFICGLKLVL